MKRFHTVLSRGVGVYGAAFAIVNGYQLVLLVAAALPRISRPGGGGQPRFLVLVPAHDEEAVLRRTLDAIAAQDYPAELVDVVVVADNCSDGTAALAREEGVHVLERDDASRPGKGWALRWALARLDAPFDALLILDADCKPSANLLAASAAALAGGADATQSDNVVTDDSDSPAWALRGAAVALMARVRAQGKDRLGLSCGLFGTGMAFRRELVQAYPWRGEALAEDLEYHLGLIDAGRRVRFVRDASVTSAMPSTEGAGLVQQRRWEAGKLQALRRWLPRLLADGVRDHDGARLHAALDLLVPPQSLLALLNVAGAVAAATAGSPRQRRLALANVGAHGVFVVGGLAVARAPRAAYTGLLHAPALAARKILLYGRLAGGARNGWEKTQR